MMISSANADYIFGNCETIVEGGWVGSLIRSMAYVWVGRCPDGDYRGLAIWGRDKGIRVAMCRREVIDLLKWKGWDDVIPRIMPVPPKIQPLRKFNFEA